MSGVILSILSAILLSLSFSSFNLWIFAWCGFVPLLMALENKSLRQSFLVAYFCGVIFWSLTVYWLIHVTLMGQIILILFLASYFGIFGCLVYLSKKLSTVSQLFFIPSVWVILEHLRSYLFTGFPWALMGFSQYRNLPIIQIADITGVWGVSFLIVLINAGAYLILRKKSKNKILLISLIALFLTLAYGFFKLNYSAKGLVASKALKVSVIQGNIPQHLKWNLGAVNFVLNNYKTLTVQAAQDKPDLVIWPEASVPGIFGQDDHEYAQVFSLAKEQNINLLVGAVSQFNQNYFNSALLVNKAGQLTAIYNKLHLVPFGEFIPFKKTFPFLETIAPIGDITAGDNYTIFKQPAEFGVLICFEDLFPELSRRFIKNGAKFLINITNDAWYKEGSAPYQHFAASVFRAIENHVYLARAANTGISGFIDPCGRILAKVCDLHQKDIFVNGQISQKIYLQSNQFTFYNLYGDVFISFCLILACFILLMSIIRKKEYNHA